MKAWLVRIIPKNGEEHWPSSWSTDLIPNNPVLICPLFTTKIDAEKYCLTLESAKPVPIELP